MCTYLAKRGATYYFRRVIPAELRPVLGGKAEFMLSLQTKDREAAKRLIPDKTKATDHLLDEARARGRSPATPTAVQPMTRGMSEFEIEQAEWVAQDEAERRAKWDAREALLPRLEDALALSTAEITPREARLRDLLRDLRNDLAVEQERRLVRSVERAEERRDVATPMPANLSRGAMQGASAKQAGETPSVMLDPTIVDLWAAERKVVQKGIDTHRGVVRWFYERVGKKSVDQITRKDVLAFKDSLIADNTAANTGRWTSIAAQASSLSQYRSDMVASFDIHAESNQKRTAKSIY